MSLTTFYFFLACISNFITFNEAQSPTCSDGFTCWEDPNSDIVWVKRDDPSINAWPCQDVCEQGLFENSLFYTCDHHVDLIRNVDDLYDISEGMGFTCVQSGGCWGYESPDTDSLVMVSSGTDSEKNCYFPQNTDITSFSCTEQIGNANCFGKRYSLICPCVAKALDEACEWDDGFNVPSIADWGNYETGTSCIDRINYWRKKACEDGWYECPEQGLPPMTECTCCHECANSQAEYDTNNWHHASFQRCGDMVQGVGGGSTCADVIDAFVEERTEDENGIMKCEGHCGPIVAHGCNTFFWGRAETSDIHVLNWRTCDPDTCDAYCENPSDNECFTLDPSIAADTSNCGDTTTTTPQPTPSPVDDEVTPDPTTKPTGRPTTPDPTDKPTTRPTVSPFSIFVNSVTTTTTATATEVICTDGYTCYSDTSNDLVWVKRDAGNVHSYPCNKVCEEGLGNNVASYGCNENVNLIRNTDDFTSISNGMGFNCIQSGGCWGYESPKNNLVMVTRYDDADKRCYFPTDTSVTSFSCTQTPGNANCFGERYSIICPCDTASASAKSNSSNNNNGNSGSVSTTMLAIILVLMFLLLVLVGVFIYYKCFRNKDKNQYSKNTQLTDYLLMDPNNGDGPNVTMEKGN